MDDKVPEHLSDHSRVEDFVEFLCNRNWKIVDDTGNNVRTDDAIEIWKQSIKRRIS